MYDVEFDFSRLEYTLCTRIIIIITLLTLEYAVVIRRSTLPDSLSFNNMIYTVIYFSVWRIQLQTNLKKLINKNNRTLLLLLL